MSKFIEFGFPCNECLVAAACTDKKRITSKDLLDQGPGVRCLALPVYDHKTSSHQKMLLECLGGMLCRVARDLNEDRGMKIPEQYRHFLIEYLGIFEWITNSSSWTYNLPEVADFDKFEIRRKLRMLDRLLDWKGDLKPE